MLLVETYIGPSSIEGLGLFAKEKILKGTKTWEFVPGIDVKFTKEKLDTLTIPAQNYLKRYCYINQVTGLYVLCSDNDRYINHSNNPNTKNFNFDLDEGTTEAIRDIMPGEEITTNYKEFDTTIEDFM